MAAGGSWRPGTWLNAGGGAGASAPEFRVNAAPASRLLRMGWGWDHEAGGAGSGVRLDAETQRCVKVQKGDGSARRWTRSGVLRRELRGPHGRLRGGRGGGRRRSPGFRSVFGGSHWCVRTGSAHCAGSEFALDTGWRDANVAFIGFREKLPGCVFLNQRDK